MRQGRQVIIANPPQRDRLGTTIRRDIMSNDCAAASTTTVEPSIELEPSHGKRLGDIESNDSAAISKTTR